MRPRQQVSRNGLELIKTFEGYRQKAARLPDGRWTIGYGHTKTARQGAEVSPADAEALLIYDLMEVTQTLAELVYTPLNQNQYDALAAFVFNVGREPFQASAVLKRINEGALVQAACAFDLWRKAAFEGEDIVIDALVRRRAAEKALFLTPAGGFVPAPSPLLKPQIDFDMSGTIPRQTPVEVTPSMEGETVTAERVLADGLSEGGPAEPAQIAPFEAPSGAAEPEAQPEPAPQSEPAATVAEAPPSNIFSLTPPDDRATAPSWAAGPVEEVAHPAAETASEPELFFPEEAVAERSVFDLSERTELTDEDMAAAEDGAGRQPGLVAYGGLAAIGLALFAGGIVIGFANSSGEQGLLSLRNLGIAVSLIGIVCTAFAVYLVLGRLGGREEPQPE